MEITGRHAAARRPLVPPHARMPLVSCRAMLTRVRRVYAYCGVAVCAAAAFLVYMGDARGAAAATLVGISALLVGSAGASSAASAKYDWLALACGASGMAILGFPLDVAAGAVVLLFVLQLIVNVHLARRFGGLELEAVSGDAVMPGAVPFVKELSSEGFRAAGGHRCRRPARRSSSR
jgi:hypothetical protein